MDESSKSNPRSMSQHGQMIHAAVQRGSTVAEYLRDNPECLDAVDEYLEWAVEQARTIEGTQETGGTGHILKSRLQGSILAAEQGDVSEDKGESESN